MTSAKEALCRLNSLSIYRKITEQGVGAALKLLLESTEGSPEKFLDAYGSFCSEVYESGLGLARLLTDAALYDENRFTRAAAAGNEARLGESVLTAVENDCKTILFLGNLTSDEILSSCACHDEIEFLIPNLPKWDRGLPAEPFRKENILSALSEFHRQNGCGMFARYKAFVWRDGEVKPVTHHDGVTLDSLKGYDYQRGLIVKNTEAFLAGRTCNNCLLYGDKGTGKSSTVKAIGNRFYKNGLRIIEIPKERLEDFPLLIEVIAPLPMKFIIFIDDLSFSHQDASYASLKAVLEGGLAARPVNALIYATSNRRHIVKERFSDREADDVNLRDNMQESLSLSDRFGLAVAFSAPGKDKFLEIVLALAERFDIKESRESLCAGAERFALARGGRSPRCARQYIESLFTSPADTEV